MMPMFSLSLYVGSSTEYLCVLFPFAMPGASALCYPQGGTVLHLPGAKLPDRAPLDAGTSSETGSSSGLPG